MQTSENQIVLSEEQHPQENEEQDYFNRLPDELIISHIFGKIPDAKCLFTCVLLSKRLAVLVIQTQTISCTINRWLPSYKDISIITQPRSVSEKLLSSLKKPVRFLSSLFHNSRTSNFDRVSFIPMMKFLMIFKFLKSLQVQVGFSDSIKRKTWNFGGPILKWKGEYLPQNSGSLVLMFAKGLHSATSDDEEDNEEDEVVTGQEVYKKLCSFRDVVRDARLRYALFEAMVPLLPNQLQNLVITDSWKQGKVVLGEAKIAELRAGLMDQKETEMSIRVRNARVIRLPLSGYVMKGVTLVEIQFGVDGIDEMESIAEAAFEGEEEEVLCEAAIRMLKKPASFEEHITSLV